MVLSVNFPICSGDTDSVVPVTASRYSIRALNLSTIINWYAWYDNDEVGATFENDTNWTCYYYLFFCNSIIIYMLRIFSSMKVGGWSQVYEGLTLVTVRGAGHEVPLHKPRQGFTLFKSFLENKNMPLPIDSKLSGPTQSLNKNIRLARPIRKITMPSSVQGFFTY